MDSPEQRKKTRAETLNGFNPDENGLNHHGIFGLPFSEEESEIILLPVPWEVTVSYKAGTSNGPKAILEASQQIDLYDPILPDGWKYGIAMQDISTDWVDLNNTWRSEAETYLELLTSGETTAEDIEIAGRINIESEKLNLHVQEQTSCLMKQGKIVGLVGGEHSVPLGYLRALAEIHNSFGILQIDAHADLREAYEGFTYSHASIFYNALQIPQVERIVQVGIRDFSEGEWNTSINSNGRSVFFTDHAIKKAAFEGESWAAQCEKIISQLPQNVYLSFDIDGLEPSLCPNTGTPVPGGFKLEEVIYLLEKLVESKRKIIGFDLCEVAPGGDEWDGNVGARVLYKLCMLAVKSNFANAVS